MAQLPGDIKAAAKICTRTCTRTINPALQNRCFYWVFPVLQNVPPMPVIGFLNGASPDRYAPMVAAFRQGLKETGYVEGQNLAIEYHWAEGQYDRVPSMAAELVRREVAVIVANSPGNLAVKAATKTIPIVFTIGGDPVQIGFVASLSRPGGNVTGVTTLSTELVPKRLVHCERHGSAGQPGQSHSCRDRIA